LETSLNDAFAMAGHAMGVCSLALSVICVVLSIVSLTGKWWQGNFGADNFAGFGTASLDFSLWHFTTNGSLLGFTLPENEFSIDSEHMCGKEQLLATAQEICSKIKAVRALVILGLIMVCGGMLSSAWALLARVNVVSIRKTLACSGIAVAIFAGLSAVCVGVAFGVAASMPGSKEAHKMGVVGAGAMCAVAQLVCCVIVMVCAIAYWRRVLCRLSNNEKQQFSEKPSVPESA